MISNYRQVVSLKADNKKKALQIVGIVLQVLSLAFIVVGVIYDFYFYIGFLVMLGLGVLIQVIYFSFAREYEYVLTETDLVFVKKDMRLRSKELLRLNVSQIKQIEQFTQTKDEKDLVVAEDISRPEVMKLEYEKDGLIGAVLFAPDDYMTALLNERLQSKS
jgi:hypothetical protein